MPATGERVLARERHAVQRPARARDAASAATASLARLVQPRQHERVDLRIALGDPRRVRLEQLERGDLALAHRASHPRRRLLDQCRHVATLARSRAHVTRRGADDPRARALPRRAPALARAGRARRGARCSAACRCTGWSRWPGGFPVFVGEARGRALHRRRRPRLRRPLPRRHRRDDRPRAARRRSRAIAEQAPRGITMMLPDRGRAVGRRGAAAPLRPAVVAVRADRHRRQPLRDPARPRTITGRPKVLVFNWCYHGTVDETFATLDADGRRRRARRATSARRSTRSRDDARRRVQRRRGAASAALAHGDVACVLAEPALTNIGIVLPEPGYHDALRAADPRDRHAAGHRRDPHDLAGPGGYTAGPRPRARPADDRQADRRRRAGRGLRLHRRGGASASSATIDRRGRRRRRHRRHARRQRAVAGRDARDARRGADRRGLRAHDRRSASASRPACSESIDRPRAALARHAARLPRRVPVPRRAAAHRRARPPPPATTSSTASCTSTRSTAASC